MVYKTDLKAEKFNQAFFRLFCIFALSWLILDAILFQLLRRKALWDFKALPYIQRQILFVSGIWTLINYTEIYVVALRPMD